MATYPPLTPAGSSTYNSPTMYVGDGTWDSSRNTFLLPNLMGLNFDTMRYNGMGNRFAELPGYFNLIQGHGIVAAITFIFLVPFSIMVLQFYKQSRTTAVRWHIWLQILTVMLVTVVFVLGFFAVGPQRSLSNPHHGIGVAVYVLILTQFVWGWFVHSRNQRKLLPYLPLKAMFHKWLGNAVALLGLVQIPLGLTLYGAPQYLFVLYTLAVFSLLVVYFVLSYRHEKDRGRDWGSNNSYASGSGDSAQEGREHGPLGRLAKAGAAGVGLAALTSRFRNRSQRRGDPRAMGSQRHSGSYIEEEKYSQYGRDPGREGGFRQKLLGIGALAGAAYWITRMLGKRHDDVDSRATESTEDSLSRMEAGHSLPAGQNVPSGQHPLNQTQTQPLNPAANHRRSTSSISYDSYVSGSPSRQRRGHGLRNAVAGLGAFGVARNLFKKRRERKEQRRIDALREQEIKEERITRANSQRYTGDGFPRVQRRRGSVTTSTDYSEDRDRHKPLTAPPLPGRAALPTGTVGAGANTVLTNPPPTASNPIISGALPTNLMTPDAQGILHNGSSGSELYTTASGRPHHRHHVGRDTATVGLAGAAAGLGGGEAVSKHRHGSHLRRHSDSPGDDSMASPSVSVKVKMHSNGRHATLRRLPEQEAAAERAARRASRDRNGRRGRAGSVSSLSGTEGRVGGERWRRTEALEREQQEELERQRIEVAQAQIARDKLGVPSPLPPPPPIPPGGFAPSAGSAMGVGPAGGSGILRPGTGGSVGSPGTYDGTGTEASADYANNRRRRRAERAQAKLAREGKAGAGAVGFT